MQQLSEKNHITHAILTCADDRLDKIVGSEVERIRSLGGKLREKDIFRPPGGVHLLAGDSDCRQAYYKYLSAHHTLFGTTVFHIWPHTNCQECGLHRPQKLGHGTKSDLWFHLNSAKRLLEGSQEHFRSLSPGTRRPEFDVRIVLTSDQKIVTIEAADALLQDVPDDIPHGRPCLHDHQGHQHSAHSPQPPMMTGLL